MTPVKKLLLFITMMSIGLVACSDKNSDEARQYKNDTLIIGVTTTLEDSGLLRQLVNAFQQTHNITIKPVVAGSGQIHKLLSLGDMSVAITHDPQGEEALIKEGVINKRIALTQNDFIIIGPKSDPANIKEALTPSDALKKIISTNALFVSRGDNSGTHQIEKAWWQTINARPNKQYYLKTGTGMGATLNVAAERGAYTFVDRATWIAFQNKQSLSSLFEDSKRLPNTYSLLIKRNALVQEKVILWRDWISTGEGSRIILNYRIGGQPLFFKAP